MLSQVCLLLPSVQGRKHGTVAHMMPVEYIVGIPEITEVCGIKENSSACVLLPVYIHIQVVTVLRMLYDRIIDDSIRTQDPGTNLRIQVFSQIVEVNTQGRSFRWSSRLLLKNCLRRT